MIPKDWDINEDRNTGKFKDGKPIIGMFAQNGLNDIEPNGSFVPCDMELDAVVDGVTTHRVKRGRYGELRFTDSASANKHLCKIKYKNGRGLSFKYLDGDSGLPDVSNGRPSFASSNGVTIEHTPTYKGVRIELVINDPLTAPAEHSFSMKTYGQNYTYIEQGGGIVARGEDLMPITIHAPYAVDANGDVGPVTMMLTEIVGDFQTFKKVVDETWLRQAIAPVRIDPNVTIDDVSGTFEDASLFASSVDANSGAWNLAQIEDGNLSVSKTSNVRRVDLSSYSGITVLNGKYSINITLLGNTVYDYEIFPILRQWNEGNKSLAAASTGEVTARSARHNELLWTTTGCSDPGTDRSTTSAGNGTLPGGLGWFDMDLTAASIQDKIDNPGINYGDVMHVKTPTGTASFYRWHSSEGTAGLLPTFYMEYTEGDGYIPFFFDKGHY